MTVLLLGGAALAVWALTRSTPEPSEAAVPGPVPVRPPSPDAERRLGELRPALEALVARARDVDERRRDLEMQRTSIGAAAAEIDRQVEETRTRQDRTRARIRLLEDDEHRLREGVPTGNEEDRLESPVLAQVRAEMNRIRGEIAIGGLDRTPSSPEYKTRAARLTALEDSWRSELYKTRAETIVALKDSLRSLDDALRGLDERRLKRALDGRDIAKRLAENVPPADEIASVRKQIEETEALLRPASVVPPTTAGRVRRVTAGSLGWGGLAVVILAIVGAFWRDAADPRVRTDVDVKRRLNLPVVAMVGAVTGDPLILRRHPQDPLCETMSTAATVLRSYAAAREFRTLAVVSAEEGEGKSTVALNLACALARKGLNVLLVDADLRRPRIHEVYGLENTRGLATLLLGPEPAEPEPDPDQMIVQTEIPTLRLLCAGPTHEIVSDLHDSPRMVDFLRSQRERFDLVVLDGAPLIGVGDSVALARVVDTCVWVVRAGTSDRRTLGWAKHLLKTVHADVAGVILNFAPSAHAERFYSYREADARE